MMNWAEISNEGWKQIVSAYNTGNTAGMVEYANDDSTLYDPHGRVFKGIEEIRGYYDTLFKKFPGMAMHIENISTNIISTEVVASQVTYAIEAPGITSAVKGSSNVIFRIEGENLVMVETNSKFFVPQF